MLEWVADYISVYCFTKWSSIMHGIAANTAKAKKLKLIFSLK